METAKTFHPVRLARASAEIVQQIKTRIFAGQLAAGDQLPSEKDLAEQFALSRITVRDALRVLESEGLIEIKVGARGGAFVAKPTAQRVSESLTTLLRLQQITIVELTEARLAVEPYVAALAAKRATAADIAAMGQAIEDARAGREAGDPRFMPHSVAFHIALADAAKNQVLRFTVNSFRTPFYEALAHLPAAAMAGRAIADHQSILQAIKARDAQRARRLMHKHLTYFAERVGGTSALKGAYATWPSQTGR
ncbi:MAG TPA: FadR/GntR family transcriptional regulator [bacterium]|nr:FadR/GntR family transcriptional regulator [bacterium]